MGCDGGAMTVPGTEQWAAPPAARPSPFRSRLRPALIGLVRGDAADPPWVRPLLLAILALATFLYAWRLDISGYANAYYAAAAQAGSQSWSAFFFGAFDAAGFITVDKPPAALWLIGLSVRLFGLSSWSILLPQAILGVATVGLVYLATRRSFGPAAGIIAALVMTLTPVAAVIFRYDNPDALLTFLLVLAAWALLRGIDTGRTRWVLLAAAVVGLAFDTKYPRRSSSSRPSSSRSSSRAGPAGVGGSSSSSQPVPSSRCRAAGGSRWSV